MADLTIDKPSVFLSQLMALERAQQGGDFVQSAYSWSPQQGLMQLTNGAYRPIEDSLEARIIAQVNAFAASGIPDPMKVGQLEVDAAARNYVQSTNGDGGQVLGGLGGGMGLVLVGLAVALGMRRKRR